MTDRELFLAAYEAIPAITSTQETAWLCFQAARCASPAPEARPVTSAEDEWLRKAALRSSKLVAPGKLAQPPAVGPTQAIDLLAILDSVAGLPGKVYDAFSMEGPGTHGGGGDRMLRPLGLRLAQSIARHAAAESAPAHQAAPLGGGAKARSLELPEGFALVPLEPTQAMVDAAVAVKPRGCFTPGFTAEESEAANEFYEGRERRADIFRAMVRAAPTAESAEAKDAARYRWLRSQHEGSTGPEFDADGLPMPMEPTACAFTVFMPDPDGIESLVPVVCLPGELDETIDAAISGTTGERNAA